MDAVGIIAEYNPFHRGHLAHIAAIRKEYGENVPIVAVMSGHYTQRGGIAIADKYTRAAAAVCGGVDLLLELPFPYSGESASVFAAAGVHILSSLGCVRVLSFGSECGDTAVLTDAAEKTLSPDFLQAVREKSCGSPEGHPESFDAVCRATYGNETADLFLFPNNLLAIEYIRESIKCKSGFTFHTIKRVGAAHDSSDEADIPSASAIRAAIMKDPENGIALLPETVRTPYLSALAHGFFPIAEEKLAPAVLSFFALNTPLPHPAVADAGGGLYRRLFRVSEKATSLSSFTQLVATRKYTNARIRRAIRNTVIGVTSSDTARMPAYSLVLAMSERGRQLLHELRKTSRIPLLTKPSDYRKLSPEAHDAAALSFRADSLYTLAFPQIPPRDAFLRVSPYRKSGDLPDFFSASFSPKPLTSGKKGCKIMTEGFSDNTRKEPENDQSHRN